LIVICDVSLVVVIFVIVVVVVTFGPRSIARPRPCGLGNGLVFIEELLSIVFGDRL
jgi:hypothetical protein